MAVRNCSAQRRCVRRRHPRRTRVETYARAKIQQQHLGSPPSTAIRSRPMEHERQTRHDSGQRPKPITTHRRPRHSLRKGERILAPVVSAVIWVVEESFGMTLPGGANDPDSRPLLALLALAYWTSRALALFHQGTMPEGTLA
jgi:hypothetical protein